MAVAGGPWPLLGVTFDGDNDNVQFPSTHPIALLLSFLGFTAGPTFDIKASTLCMEFTARWQLTKLNLRDNHLFPEGFLQ